MVCVPQEIWWKGLFAFQSLYVITVLVKETQSKVKTKT